MKRLRAFAHFWHNFIFGDDWVMAVAVILAFYVVSRLPQDRINPWYIMPVVVVFSLGLSVFEAADTKLKNRDWISYSMLIAVVIALLLQQTPSYRSIMGAPTPQQTTTTD